MNYSLDSCAWDVIPVERCVREDGDTEKDCGCDCYEECIEVGSLRGFGGCDTRRREEYVLL